MKSNSKVIVNYVTSNKNKMNENQVFAETCFLSDGTLVKDGFDFRIREVPIKEVLEVDLSTMVLAEATEAYSQIRVPCIVEHAGLIFEGFETDGYPGGLTKPMWNALRDRFISETQSANRRVIARAVVAYCDGKSVHTFVGETKGSIASNVRGTTHRFYWDTVFVPDNSDGSVGSKTYAEIVEDPNLGLKFKVLNLSQSSKAMLKFLEFRKANEPELWRS